VTRLVLATRNAGKLRELNVLLGGRTDLELETLADHPEVGEVEETGTTFEENAALKATAAARATGLWALGEDSGLAIDALGGAPGVTSARWAGTQGDDSANNERLIKELEGIEQRSARYVCVMVLARGDGEVVATVRGTCEGTIAFEPRGSGGFGYDPYFVPEARRQTMAELAPDEKDALSHRGQAARSMLPLIEAHLF
jgi:XTP/dITP diphosphohydrolase